MAKPLPGNSGLRPRTRTGPGYELELSPVLFRKGAAPPLSARLTAIWGRSGAAIGDAYAFVAGHVLVGVEWVEDLTAARRLRHHSAPPSPHSAPSPLTPGTEKTLPPAE